MNTSTAKRAADFAALARQLAEERTSAADRLTELLHSTPREEWLQLADNRELHNNGALERLSKEVHTALDRQPQDARPLSALAVSIAESIGEDQYPAVVMAQIRAHAWKDRAQALWFTGSFDEAYDAITRADEVLSAFGTAAHDRALVRLVMASILQNLKKFDESLILLAECRKVFEEHHDAKLLMNCGINEAVALARQKRFEESATVLSDILEAGYRDLAGLAAVHNNLALVLVELGRTVEANVHVSQAVKYFNDTGNHVGALRSELAMGRVFAAKNRTTEALLRLRNAQRSFAERGLIEEAAICGLDVAGLLLAEQREAEAQQMFESVREHLADVNERARELVADLAERFVAHDATPAAVRHVSELLATLRSERGAGSASTA